MGEVPSLLSLCTKTIIIDIIHGDHYLDNLLELPWGLLEHLLMHLPAVALQKLQGDNLTGTSPRGITLDNRKRERYGDFNTAWKTLYESRWSEGVKKVRLNDCMATQAGVASELAFCCEDWQQMYWEAHIQDCLDEAAETALLPSFNGCIGEIAISDSIMKSMGLITDTGHDCSKLSYHCQQFGFYARRLRLHNVLCIAETCELLKDSKLQGLVFRSIKSKIHVDGACKILNHNRETLLSLEIIHSMMPPSTLSEICDSLCLKTNQRYGIRYFSIKFSHILESNTGSVPIGFLSFLSSARSLCTLCFSYNHLGPDFAKMVFCTLLGSSSGLSTLELSDSNIAGFLSKESWKFLTCLPSSFGVEESMKFLRILNLRGDNFYEDDVENLKSALVYIPNLQSLDISDNPFGDDGIRILIPYIVEASEKASPLVELKLDNCDLSYIGMTQFLQSISTLRRPLEVLSIADNELGSRVAEPLARFLGSTLIRNLNIEGIGLGPTGFLKLEKEMPMDVKLYNLNISKNRGGIESANFVSKLILRAPELLVLNASSNFIPAKSLLLIAAALKLSKGKLEKLDLTGVLPSHATHHDMFADFHNSGKPIVILSSSPAIAAPYDDDP